MPKPQMRVFIATVADGERVDGTDVRAPRAHRIDAAYYQTGDAFTTFKDADNQAVFTANNACLMSVSRAPEDGDPHTLFRNLLAEADKRGHATGQITERETDPDGHVYEHGYAITVSTLASKEA